MKSIKSAINRNRSRRSLGSEPRPTRPASPPPPLPSTDDTSSSARQLDLYRTEIDNLRIQLRESQQDRIRKERTREQEIAHLKRQLVEATTTTRRSAEEEEEARAQPSRQDERRTETVESAIKYLDGVIRRVSNAAAGQGPMTNGPKTNKKKKKNKKKSVEIFFPPELFHDDEGEAMPEALEASLHSSFTGSDGNDNRTSASRSDASSWQPAGATAAMIASADDDLSRSLYTALSVDDTSSWQPAGTMAALLAAADDLSQMSSSQHGSLYTAPSADTSSWRPAGAMADMLASAYDDCSTVGTVSDQTWMTAADDDGNDDDDDDMQTCVSGLTLHTSHKGKSSGSGSSSRLASNKDVDSAAIVAELSRIQSHLCSILNAKDGK